MPLPFTEIAIPQSRWDSFTGVTRVAPEKRSWRSRTPGLGLTLRARTPETWGWSTDPGGLSAGNYHPSTPFPFLNLNQATAAEMSQIAAAHAQWLAQVVAAIPLGATGPVASSFQVARAALGIPATMGIASWIADQGFHNLYDVGQIPGKPRGAGWNPYVDSWVRMFDSALTRTWVSYPGA